MTIISPDWPAPERVKSLITTRMGGVSASPYDSLNLGSHVGDDSGHVAQNRAILRNFLPAEPKWLNQVHGTRVADLDADTSYDADAAYTRKANVICAVLTADCLPVLLAGRNSVGALHAGWRGLAAGIIEETVAAMKDPSLIAYLGPAIGQGAFEVGEEVYDAFREEQHAFVRGSPGKWHADLYGIARAKLEALGITQIYGGNYCTHAEKTRFFSFRRDGKTGRMGSFIWLEEQ